MADQSTTKSRAILASAAIALALGIGGYLALRASPETVVTGSSHKTQAIAPATAKRFHVPVSMSQPKRGAEDALVTIVQWCDFHSQGCKDVEPVIDELLKAYPAQVRVAFRHYADPSSMPGLEEHELTRMAFENAGKFFEAKALLMAAPGIGTRADLEQITAQLGMDWSTVQKHLDQHRYAASVVADRTFAAMFEVESVPAFFVNGRRLEGEANVAAFRALVDEELARAEKLVQGGVARDKVYAEAIKDGVWKKPNVARN